MLTFEPVAVADDPIADAIALAKPELSPALTVMSLDWLGPLLTTHWIVMTPSFATLLTVMVRVLALAVDWHSARTAETNSSCGFMFSSSVLQDSTDRQLRIPPSSVNVLFFLKEAHNRQPMAGAETKTRRSGWP